MNFNKEKKSGYFIFYLSFFYVSDVKEIFELVVYTVKTGRYVPAGTVPLNNVVSTSMRRPYDSVSTSSVCLVKNCDLVS